MLVTTSAKDLIPVFQQGGVFAYPTESVYGLGCNPDNENSVMRLLAIKNRPIGKGLILVATDYSQVSQYLDISHSPRSYVQLKMVSTTTYTYPVNDSAPSWLTGEFDSIAIRISGHPAVIQLCNAFDSAIVSTSANFSGQPAAKSFAEVMSLFNPTDYSAENKPTALDAVFNGLVGDLQNPSTIRDGVTGRIIRT